LSALKKEKKFKVSQDVLLSPRRGEAGREVGIGERPGERWVQGRDQERGVARGLIQRGVKSEFTSETETLPMYVNILISYL